MSKEKLLYDIGLILEQYPNWNGNIFIHTVNDLQVKNHGTFISVGVIYDSLVFEHKNVSIDKKGAYIGGRKCDKAKIYLSEFDGLKIPEEVQKYIDDEVIKIKSAEATIINNKLIKAGTLFEEFSKNKDKNYSIYIGTIKTTNYNNKQARYHQYIKYLDAEDVKQILDGTYNYDDFYISESTTKNKACKIVSSIDAETLTKLIEDVEYNYKRYRKSFSWSNKKQIS